MAPPVDSATNGELDDTTENFGVEITPEMIEAGVEVLADSDLRFERRSTVVINIFMAMILASREAAWKTPADK